MPEDESSIPDEESSILEQARSKLRALIAGAGLGDVPVRVDVRALEPEEAIGTVERTDYPIVAGKEAMIEAHLLSGRAQAFTDAPSEFRGTLNEIVENPLDTNARRALFIATLNALLAHLGRAKGTLHCRNDDPVACGREIAGHILERKGPVNVGLIGFNPAIAEALARTLGTDRLRITDLNGETVGANKFGITIEDGARSNGDLVDWADLLLVTGTTLVNNTFDALVDQIQGAAKDFFVFGVTGAGICHLMDLPRICPRAGD